MMYHMKNIINHGEEINLPKCMYRIKNPNELLKNEEVHINISDQVMKFLKMPNKNMAELEERQDQLLEKLDLLYERIKTISVHCKQSSFDSKIRTLESAIPFTAVPTPEEIVVAFGPEHLPWFLNIFLKESALSVNLSWHIHSSVPNEKVPKIKAFVNKLKTNNNNPKINLRLIFKGVSADPELKSTSLAVPVVGNVNILRYLAFAYPSVVPYDHKDFQVDALLDICHLLERAPEKNKESLISKLFSQHKKWIYKNEFSIVDIAAYSVVKQWQNTSKYVPKPWLAELDKLCL